MQTRPVTAALVVALATALTSAKAQQPPQPDGRIDSATMTQVVARSLRKLRDLYVFPELAPKIAASIEERAKRGDYDRVASGREFARLLTEHLQAVSHDRHLRVVFNAEPMPEPKGDDGPSQEQRARFSEMLKSRNYGFEKVERLDGNVGYLRFDYFAPADEAGDTLAGAMSFLANTDSLIIDLRQNGGGHPDMVALLCSYLFGPEPVHLNDIYSRPNGKTTQYWTRKSVPGKRYAGKDVYVLTSHRTFSGAEECAYDLQTQKRAIIVGETTGGGANPGGSHWVDPHYSVFVPTGRAINPLTKTNWEGVGVKPDVEVSASSALKTAHLRALRSARDRAASSERREDLDQTIRDLEANGPR